MIVGGLGLAMLLTLFLTPVAYLLLAGLSKPRAEEGRRLELELARVRPAELDADPTEGAATGGDAH